MNYIVFHLKELPTHVTTHVVRNNMAQHILCINDEQVKKVLKYDDLIPLMEKACAQFSKGSVLQPVRSIIPIEKHNGFVLVFLKPLESFLQSESLPLAISNDFGDRVVVWACTLCNFA